MVVSSDRYRIMNKGKTVITSDDLDAAVETARSELTKTSGPYTVVEVGTGNTAAILRYEDSDGVVKITPHVSRGAQGEYTSPVVLDREWADGHVDYTCIKEGCSYSGETAHSITAHQRAHSDKSKWKSYESKKARLAREAAEATPEPAPIDWRSRIVRDGTSEGVPQAAETSETNGVDTAERKLRRILMIVAPELAREVEDLRARAEAAEAKLAKFKALIGD